MQSLAADFCKLVCCFIPSQSHVSRHQLEEYWELNCQPGKGGSAGPGSSGLDQMR